MQELAPTKFILLLQLNLAYDNYPSAVWFMTAGLPRYPPILYLDGHLCMKNPLVSVTVQRVFRAFSLNRCLAVLAAGLMLAYTAFAASTEKLLHSFNEFPQAYYPQGGLISDGKGHFYGTASRGGTHGQGSVFEVSLGPSGQLRQREIFSFTGGLNGATPMGDLVFDKNGHLFGAAIAGGNAPLFSSGVAYELVPMGSGEWKEKVIFRFGGTNGDTPNGGLVFDQAGNLYGTTAFGGPTNSNGVAYQLTPTPRGLWKHKTLHAFVDGAGGFYPNGNLVLDGAGNIYGTALQGGGSPSCFNGCGVVFQLTPSGGSWTENILYAFDPRIRDSYGPRGGVIFDSAGNLYGTNSGIAGGFCSDDPTQCGSVFELTPGTGVSWTETILHMFTGDINDGEDPHGSLTFDAAGNLYGTAAYGGNTNCKDTVGNGCGVVFQLTPSGGSWTENVLYKFVGAPADGFAPRGGVVLDANGNVYGTTSEGGVVIAQTADYGSGSVFKLTPSGGTWTESSVFLFPHGDALTPSSGLISDSAGNLYGTTFYGGAFGYGTVFELSPAGAGKWTSTVLYNFGRLPNKADGNGPIGGLTLDQSGNLYGTTEFGGAYSEGTVFELSFLNGKWKEKVLHSFNFNEPYIPLGGVIFDSAGNLYGTTSAGGSFAGGCLIYNGCGSVFELTPSGQGSWTLKVLYLFAGGTTDGWAPFAGLVFDTAGNLYGTTLAGAGININCGGSQLGCGTVFKLSPNGGTWTESIILQFDGLDGFFPQAPLVFDKSGNLYGTAALGGGRCFANNCGSVFQLVPGNGTWTENVIYSFGGLNAGDGAQPLGPVVFDQAGNLFGTTSIGGNSACVSSGGCGVVFELIPDQQGGWTETLPHTFQGYFLDGEQPQTGLFIDGLGNLFGTTAYGGAAGDGSVFEVKP